MTDQPERLSTDALPPGCPAWAGALFGELALEGDLTSYRVVEVLGLLKATRESLTGGAMSGWGETDGAPEWLSMVVQAHRDADRRFGAAHVVAEIEVVENILDDLRVELRRVVAKVEWRQGELFPRVGFIVTNMSAGPEGVVRFYNGRGTAEQWIKEGKYALNWTRLSCHRFVANRVRLSLFILAYNLGNFLRRLCLPRAVKHWSLRSVQVKLIKMGGRLVRHSRRLIFQLSEVSVPRRLFQGVLDRIGRLSPAPS